MSDVKPSCQNWPILGSYLVNKRFMRGGDQEAAQGDKWVELLRLSLQHCGTSSSTAVKQNSFASVAASVVNWELPQLYLC